MSESTERLEELIESLETDTADGKRTELFELLYSELRQVARQAMLREGSGHTLQATALVNETYLRLAADSQVVSRGRSYFMAAARQAMKRILIEHSRKKMAKRRGGDLVRVPFDEAEVTFIEAEPSVVSAAFERLQRLDAQLHEVALLRGLGGQTIQETAILLGMSDRSVVNKWSTAVAWLRCELDNG